MGDFTDVAVRIFKDTCGQHIFDISTQDLLRATCFKIMNARFINGLYGDEDLLTKPPIPPDMPFAQVETMVDKNTKFALKQLWDNYTASLVEHKQAVTHYQMATCAIDQQDGDLAIRLIELRKDFAYEGYEDSYMIKLAPMPAIDVDQLRSF